MLPIETPRLILRDFTADDWPAVLAYQQDPDYLRYYPWSSRTPEDVKGFLGIFLGWQEASPRFRYQLAVTLKDSEQLIGNAGIRRPHASSNVAELGYELGSAYWGQGYATEAAGALVEFGFQSLALERIEANCNAENLASARVLEKLGFTKESRLERDIYFKGRWWDSFTFGLERETKK